MVSSAAFEAEYAPPAGRGLLHRAGRDVDDAAAAARGDAMARERLDRAERAGHVHVEHAPPLLGRHLRQERVGIGGRVVDEHVERAEALDDVLDGAGRDDRDADVAHDRQHARVGAPRLVLGQVQDRDPHPRVEQRTYDRAADAVRAACDERRPAVEIVGD